MKRNKLVVLSVDALLWEDLYIARNYPGFSRIMKQHCGVEQVLSVYPTQTYPIHVVQATGQNMMDTGVYNNEAFQPGRLEPDWCWDVSYIKVPTIFDAAKKAGLTTCAIMWPVLARADIDFNIPEVWDLQKWEDPHIIFEPNCSAKGYEYFKKHVSKLEWHPKPGLDEFAVCLGEDILRNEMPDISFIHVSAVDIARHLHGMECPEVVEAIQKVDSWICRLLQAIDDAGYGEKTNFVICSDHGHLKVDRQVNLNVILREKGFITLDPVSEKVLDYKAYGLLNYAARLVGLPESKWLQSPDTAMKSIIITSVWKLIGYDTLILIAALQSIPKSIFEAAELDNAPKAVSFFKIILPMVSPSLFFLLVMNTLSMFQNFDTIAVMTQGGPLGSTNTLVYYIYQNAFTYYKLGYASAAGTVLTVIVGIMTIIYFRLLGKKVHYQ